MKRDMDLIRLILLDREEEEKVDLSAYSEEKQVYHTALAIEAKLIHGAILEDNEGNPRATVTVRLTWAGHDFLDATRDKTIWKEVKAKLAEKAMSVSFDILIQLIQATAKAHLGLP